MGKQKQMGKIISRLILLVSIILNFYGMFCILLIIPPQYHPSTIPPFNLSDSELWKLQGLIISIISVLLFATSLWFILEEEHKV